MNRTPVFGRVTNRGSTGSVATGGRLQTETSAKAFPSDLQECVTVMGRE
jgi:hypothetical protein